ncbi:MAG: sulfotransferase domain-containing protein [Chloroflexota bacterium]
MDASLKTALKQVRWRLRRAQAAWRYGAAELAHTPAVLGNAMPKSGSHLINQVVQGLTQLGPFVNPGFPPVNRDQANAKQADAVVAANLQRMLPGDIAYGYVQCRPPFQPLLTAPGRATIFVYRDPRDMLVSHVFYATEMHKGHGMHTYYSQELKTMEARLNAAIRGVDEPGSELSPIRAKYEGYLGWRDAPEVLCLRFEDLILDRRAALNRLLDYLNGRGFTSRLPRQQEIAILEQAIAPKKSGTFRKGQPGNWKDHFTPANIAFFKEQTGDLLVRMGYESSMDW